MKIYENYDFAKLTALMELAQDMIETIHVSAAAFISTKDDLLIQF